MPRNFVAEQSDHLASSPAKVVQALTDPKIPAKWIPSATEPDFRPGSAGSFSRMADWMRHRLQSGGKSRRRDALAIRRPSDRCRRPASLRFGLEAAPVVSQPLGDFWKFAIEQCEVRLLVEWPEFRTGNMMGKP